MRVEKISTNQPKFEGKNYRSIFNRFTNLFTKQKNEQAFVTTATASATAAIATIEINKKEYEAPKLINKTIAEVKQDTLNEIIPNLPEISDEEYKDLKTKICADEKIHYIIHSMKLNPKDDIGKAETQLIAKILSNKDLLESKPVRKYAQNIIFSPPMRLKPERAKVINFVFDNERLYNDEKMMYDVLQTIPFVDSSNVNLVLKLLSDKRFSDTYFRCGSEILFANRLSDNPQKSAQIKNSVIDKFLSDEKLYNNKNVCSEISRIVYFAKNDKDLEHISKLFDKYLNSPELINQKHIRLNIGNIVGCVNSDIEFDLANRILETPELYKNKYLFNSKDGFGSNIGRILDAVRNPEKAKYVNEFLDVYLSDEKLYTNENLNKGLSYVLATMDKDNLEFRKSLMAQYVNNSVLQQPSVAKNLGILINCNDSKMNYELTDKILNDARLYNNDAVMDKAGDILIGLKRPEDADFVSKFLDKDEIISDKKIIDSLPDIEWLMNFGTDKTYKLKSKVLEKVLNDEKLYANKNVMYELPNIIKNIRFDEQLEIANIVLNSENLFNNNEILANLPIWLEKIDGYSEPNMKFYDELKSRLTK